MSPAKSSPSAKTPSKHTRRNRYLFIAVFLFALILTPFLFAGAVSFYFQYYDLILPGVKVGGLDLSWKSRSQGALELNQLWNEGRELRLSDGEQTWSTSPPFLGLWMDPNQTIENAFAVGRGPDAIDDLLILYHQKVWNIEPVVLLNPGLAQLQLQRWSEQITILPQEATLHLQAGQVLTAAGRSGRTLDVDKTLQALSSDPRQILETGLLWVYWVPTQPEVMDLSAAAARVQAVLDTTIQAQAYDPIANERLEWQVPREFIVDWVTLEETPEGPKASLDLSRAAEYLAGLEADLGPGRTFASLPDEAAVSASIREGKPIQLELEYLPTEYIAEAGDTLFKIGWKVGIPYWRMQKANPGIHPNALAAGQKIVVPPKDDLLPLPIIPDKRIIISIGEQHMWVLQNGEELKDFVISTGIANSPTQPGVYQILTHELNAYASNWNLFMPHFMGIYEAWPNFMNGIHGLPMLSNGRRLWADVLGRPASYGCIILDLPSAEWLYSWAEAGVVVEIRE